MYGMNPFRILADLSHALSKCILIVAIHRYRSAEGVSLITQTFYAIVFCTRYLDLLMVLPWIAIRKNAWNFFFKIFYIISSFYILFLMTRVYARSRERELAWKICFYSLVGAFLLAPFLTFVLPDTYPYEFALLTFYNFSLVLESVCVLPQLLLLRQTTVPTVIDSYYLVVLGSYRALYILNWIWRELDDEYSKPNVISVTFGIVQTLLYIDFAWVYWTRQRVKLRAGGIVDADDLSRGWLLNRLLGRTQPDEADGAGEASNGDGDSTRHKAGGQWGARGISVSADDSALDIESLGAAHPDAKMRDPEELARVLDEDED